MEDGKYVECQETDNITSDCYNVLNFLQSIAVKAPRVVEAPLYLRVNRRTREWFRRWYYHHKYPLTNLPTDVPQ